MPTDLVGPSTAYIPHILLCIYYLKKILLLELSANFCRALSVFFRYAVCTHVSTVEAYTAFIIRSCDYILSKAGLFSTKLSLTIPRTRLYILHDVMNQHYTKSALLII